MSEGKKVLLIYTGGTIGMVPDPATGVLRPFSLDALMQRIPELNELDCTIDLHSFDQPVDSSDMHIPHWQALGELIHHHYSSYDGFVVLHGSDTMAYSAAVLSFMLEDLQKPVVLTGSQLPIGVLRSDAKENLLTALEIACAQNTDGRAIVPEVGVYFEYDLFRGNRVHKENTEDFEAFRSPNYPKLAESGVRLKFRSEAILQRKGSFRYHPELSASVGVLSIQPSLSLEWLRHQLHSTDMACFVLQSFGSGNLPTDPAFLGLLQEAIDSGKVLVNVSQCRTGAVQHGMYGTSEALDGLGIVSGRDILLEAAWAKLMHLHGLGLSADEIREGFAHPICGEMSL